MRNCTDHRDDEVYKVKARDKIEALAVAEACQDWRGRFCAGWCLPYIAKNKRDREFLKEYRWWATDHTDYRLEDEDEEDR